MTCWIPLRRREPWPFDLIRRCRPCKCQTTTIRASWRRRPPTTTRCTSSRALGAWIAFKLTMAWYGVATAFFYIYLAAFIALAYGTVNALIGIALTVVAYSLINTIILRFADEERADRRPVLAQHVRLRRRCDRHADLRRDVHLLPRLRGLGHRGRGGNVLRRPDQALVRDRHRPSPPPLVWKRRADLAGSPAASLLPFFLVALSPSSRGRSRTRAITASCPTRRRHRGRRCRGCRPSRRTWACGC